MKETLQYKTHSSILEQVPGIPYTKITNYVDGKVYDDIVSAIIMDEGKSLHFVHFERELLSGFLASLVAFHNNKYKGILPQFYTFDSELSYYQYCIDNDLDFEEQEWFKTGYIKINLSTALDYLKNASILLQRTLYPEFLDASTNRLVDIKVPTIKPEKPKIAVPPKPQPSIFKCSPSLYSSFLEEHHIDCLYHFTSTDNVDSIRKNGICSAKYLHDKGINVSYASSGGSREIDIRKGKADYVHLSYERKNPMLYIALKEGRLANYVIYEISTDVLFLKETLFTHCNAAKNGVKFSDDINYMLQIPFDSFHNRPYNKESVYKDYFMSEVLVKQKVSPLYILNL